MDRNGVIGAKGDLPWHISADLKNFKKITMGKPIDNDDRTSNEFGTW